MIKRYCDTCGAEVSRVEYFMKITKSGPLEVIGIREFDLCEKCMQKIIKAAERHSWEAPNILEEIKGEDVPKRGGKKKDIDYGKIGALHRAGWTGRAIAADLGISEGHVSQILKKLREEGQQDEKN